MLQSTPLNISESAQPKAARMSASQRADLAVTKLKEHFRVMPVNENFGQMTNVNTQPNFYLVRGWDAPASEQSILIHNTRAVVPVTSSLSPALRKERQSLTFLFNVNNILLKSLSEASPQTRAAIIAFQNDPSFKESIQFTTQDQKRMKVLGDLATTELKLARAKP